MTSSAQHDLISARTRRAVRELMSGTVLRDIEGMWQDEHFVPGPHPDPPVGGERVSLFQSYLDGVNWHAPGHVRRALRVFEVALYEIGDDYKAKAIRFFAEDGYRYEDGHFVGGPLVVLREQSLASLIDPAVIREHLDRIERAIQDDDAAQAIGSAKELIESTAKVVLRERRQTLKDQDDLPALVRAAQLALGLHPTTVSPGPDSSDAIKKILGGASTVASGIAELRNRGYGTGHGDADGQKRITLRARHARLAVAGAKLWCEFMLDTLSDERAPGRKHQTPS